MHLSKFLFVLIAFALTTLDVARAERLEVIEPSIQLASVKRFALVIGNSAYESVPVLQNTLSDARAVAAKARDLGYKIFLAEDLDRLAMNRVISDFLVQIEPGSEVLVYYAGHGVELQGSNFLFPIDTPMLSPDQDRLLRTEAVNLSGLLEDLESRSARVTLVVLDACRDNPFQRPGTRSLGNTRGLGRVDPPSGTFVIYAAGAGEAALDSLGSNDADKNGVFTRSLLKLMGEEGLELRAMVRKLRQEVRTAALTATGHSQTPSYYDQLLGDFYFRPKSLQPVEKSACEILVKEDAKKSDILFNDYTNIVAACERVLAANPSDLRIRSLLDLAREQQAFQSAITSQTRTLGEAYLQLFPAGRYRTEVSLYLASLKTLVDPRPDPSPIPPSPQPLDITTLTRALQTELARTGCYNGTVDGDWGPRSRKAASEFAKYAKIELSALEPTADLLDVIRPMQSRICPLICSAQYELKGEACVLKTCAAGETLSKSGSCIAKKTVQVVKPKVQPKKQTSNGNSGNCFTFNGSRYCE